MPKRVEILKTLGGAGKFWNWSPLLTTPAAASLRFSPILRPSETHLQFSFSESRF
jgi:hypothetical protein